MAQEIDRATLSQAQRGEPSACRALVACYEKPVFALLWRMLNPRGKDSAVEDLAQETFLRVFRKLPDFSSDGPARLSTWILTIATRLALNELRRKTTTEPLSTNIPERTADGQADELVRQRALATAVESAIAGLSPDYRSVFLLAEYHELSHQEIAMSLDIRPGTVKSRLSRARQYIAKQLSEYVS